MSAQDIRGKGQGKDSSESTLVSFIYLGNYFVYILSTYWPRGTISPQAFVSLIETVEKSAA